MTSTGELVDFELTKVVDVDDFRSKLQAQLPDDVPVYNAEEISLQLPSSTKSLDKAAYVLALNTDAETSPDNGEWASWVAKVLEASEIMHTKTTKSGKKKDVNLRSRLFALEVVDALTLEKLPDPVKSQLAASGQCVLRYVGSCRNDGTLLRPRGVLAMLESVSGQTLTLGHIHRERLILAEA